MPRLVPCPDCQRHLFADACSCPHCGATLRTCGNPMARRAAAAMLGLALAGCTEGSTKDEEEVSDQRTDIVQPDYGVAWTDSDTDLTEVPSDTDVTEAPSDTEVPTDTGLTDTDPPSDTDGVQVDYGVAWTDTDTDPPSDTDGVQVDYGVAWTDTDTDPAASDTAAPTDTAEPTDTGGWGWDTAWDTGGTDEATDTGTDEDSDTDWQVQPEYGVAWTDTDPASDEPTDVPQPDYGVALTDSDADTDVPVQPDYGVSTVSSED